MHTTALRHRVEDDTTFLWIRDGWPRYDARGLFVFIAITMAKKNSTECWRQKEQKAVCFGET